MGASASTRVGMPLSPRQHEALASYARLGSHKEVAESLGIAPHTLKNLLGNAYAKLGVSSAIGAFQRLGWLWIPQSDTAEVHRLRAELKRLQAEVTVLVERLES